MRLYRLCLHPSRAFYIAACDTGTFVVPRAPGGWAQRRPWRQADGVVCQSVEDVESAAKWLGLIPPDARRLGGCNCYGRRS